MLAHCTMFYQTRMKSKNKNLSIILWVLVLYTLIGSLFAPFTILFLGYIDWVILLSTGLINTLLLFKIYKLSFIKSLIIGFLISSVSLTLTYLLFFFTAFESFTIILFLYLISSILSLLLINNKNWMFSSPIKLFFLACASILCFFLAINLKNYYPNESRNIKTFSFLLVDSYNKPIIGDSIEISILRQPMLNLQEIHTKEKLISDNEGKFKASLSQSTIYDIRVFNSENWMIGSYEINYSDLKTNDDIVLEISK